MVEFTVWNLPFFFFFFFSFFFFTPSQPVANTQVDGCVFFTPSQPVANKNKKQNKREVYTCFNNRRSAAVLLPDLALPGDRDLRHAHTHNTHGAPFNTWRLSSGQRYGRSVTNSTRKPHEFQHGLLPGRTVQQRPCWPADVPKSR